MIRKRYDLKTELKLALLPTFIMASVLFFLETYGGGHHLLFSSLASSAFLIYLDPQHPTNHIFTLVVAQVSAALIGFGILKLLGPGYVSAALAMVVSIFFMVVANVMHPPAVSTSLTFAFETGKMLPLFMVALGLLVVLIILQKISVWIIEKNPADHLPDANH